MKGRWILLGVIAALVLALTAGLAFAAGAGHRTPGWSTVATVDHDAMHDSAAMQRMHAQMPAGLAQQCDAMHERMDQMMTEMGSMMGGSDWKGMMGGSSSSGMMGGSSGTGMMGGHASHHSTGG